MNRIICKINNYKESSNIKIISSSKFSYKDKVHNFDMIYHDIFKIKDIFDIEIEQKLNQDLFLFFYGDFNSGKYNDLFGSKDRLGLLDYIIKNFNNKVTLECIELGNILCKNFVNGKLINVYKSNYKNDIQRIEINSLKEYFNLHETFSLKRQLIPNNSHLIFNIYSKEKPIRKITVVDMKPYVNLIPSKTIKYYDQHFINTTLNNFKKLYNGDSYGIYINNFIKLLKDCKNTKKIIFTSLNNKEIYSKINLQMLKYFKGFKKNDLILYNLDLKDKPIIKIIDSKKDDSLDKKLNETKKRINSLEKKLVNFKNVIKNVDLLKPSYIIKSISNIPKPPKLIKLSECKQIITFPKKKITDKFNKFEILNFIIYKKVINNFVKMKKENTSVDGLIIDTKASLQVIAEELSELL